MTASAADWRPGDIADNGTAVVTLTGSIAAINATLADPAGLTYQGVLDYNGPDTLTVDVNDNGHNGDGGAQTASQTVNIIVTPVSDANVAPTILVPTVLSDAFGGVSVDPALWTTLAPFAASA